MAKVTFKERFVSVKINKGETVVNLKPGQFIFGRFKAEEELSIDGSTIYKWMRKFSSPEFGMITIESNNQFSIVTLCNWEQYNGDDITEVTAMEQQCNNHVTTMEQPCNTNKNDNNVKNVKNNKPEKIFSEEVNSLFNSVVIFFDENCRPKNEKEKSKWLDTLDKLIRIEKHSPEHIQNIVKRTRMDDFWRPNFLTINKLRKNNPEGISYFTVFEKKMTNGNKKTVGADPGELAQLMADKIGIRNAGQ